MVRALMVRRLVPYLAVVCLSPLACSSPEGSTTSTADSYVAEVSDDAANDTLPVDSARIDDRVADTALGLESGTADAAVSEVASDAVADSTETSCKNGSVQEESCGKCGTHSRLCDASKWLDWSGCFGETGSCVPGDKRSVACGRCGTRAQTCNGTCSWDSDVCVGEGACVPGSKETSYGSCLDTTNVKTRTCSESCAWSAWSDCK